MESEGVFDEVNRGFSDLEEKLERSYNKSGDYSYLNSSESFDDHLLEDPFFDHDESSTSGNVHMNNSMTSGFSINDSYFCKWILHTHISGTYIRIWDLMIFIPNFIFFVILMTKFFKAKQKLRSSNSPIFLTFYGLVTGNLLVNIIHCSFSMIVDGSDHEGNLANRLLYVSARFFLLSTELSVIVFALAFGRLDRESAIRRVIIVTSCTSLAFSLTQAILEINSNETAFYGSKLQLYSHGGTLFWVLSSLFFALLYVFILCLPLLPSNNYFLLPHKRSFYYYITFLASLYLFQFVGSLLLYDELAGGLCFVDLTTFSYFTLFIPLVYYTFLHEFFCSAQPTLLFSYKAQLDEFDDDVSLPQHRPVDSLENRSEADTLVVDFSGDADRSNK